MAAKAAEWDERHPKTSNGVPSRLYTDENPATTIKGLGYKNRAVAERTILLTSQPGVRYKQYWMIKAMRERANYHAHPTKEMKEAIVVFDEWLANYQPPSPEARKEQEKEWNDFRKLCQTSSNLHSYGKDPSKDDMDRARKDLRCGKSCLVEGLTVSKTKNASQIPFPATAFTALFGGPGIHGYGRHHIQSNTSHVVIEGKAGLEELLSKLNKSLMLRIEGMQSIELRYDIRQQKATVLPIYSIERVTLKSLWKNSNHCEATSGQKPDKEEPSWSCSACTFEHCGKAKQLFLACELCRTSRSNPDTKHASGTQKKSTATMTTTKVTPIKMAGKRVPSTLSAWGSLKPPSQQDIRGRYKRQKALDAPPPMLDFLVVLDFEWTADNKKKMEPTPEITQFPSVVMQLLQKQKGIPLEPPPIRSDIPLPWDLTTSSPESFAQDAFAISAFDTFVRPTFNPKLSDFSTELTAITQSDVDAAPTIDLVLQDYVRWLQSLDLLDSSGNRKGNWCFATWGDGDIMSTLRQELQYKNIPLPSFFDRWINLKSDSMFKKHYGREPRGGLRCCVESVAVWEGRAHNGLVDSLNTAKIVRHMVQTGFRFVRSTRGLNKDGVPFGQKRPGEGPSPKVE